MDDVVVDDVMVLVDVVVSAPVVVVAPRSADSPSPPQATAINKTATRTTIQRTTGLLSEGTTQPYRSVLLQEVRLP